MQNTSQITMFGASLKGSDVSCVAACVMHWPAAVGFLVGAMVVGGGVVGRRWCGNRRWSVPGGRWCHVHRNRKNRQIRATPPCMWHGGSTSTTEKQVPMMHHLVVVDKVLGVGDDAMRLDAFHQRLHQHVAQVRVLPGQVP